jgi:hypothetical protein
LEKNDVNGVSWFMVNGSWQLWFIVNGNLWFKVKGMKRQNGISKMKSTNMAYEKKEYKKRIEGCHNL